MGNGKNKGGQGRPQGGRNYYKLYLYQVLVSWGFVPPFDATVKQLKQLIQTALVQLSVKKGTYEMDPETPDSELAGLIPAMASRGVGMADITNVIALARSGGAALMGSDGELTTLGDAAAENDSWAENTQSWWDSTWGLNGATVDWNEGWNQFCQGWDDFWAGNF